MTWYVSALYNDDHEPICLILFSLYVTPLEFCLCYTYKFVTLMDMSLFLFPCPTVLRVSFSDHIQTRRYNVTSLNIIALFL